MSDETYPLTDVGNGLRFVRDHARVVRWLIDEQQWVVWEGTHWQRYTSDEKVTALAKQTSASILDEATALEDTEKRNKVARWAIQSQSAQRLGAMVKMAKSDHRLWSNLTDFDQDVVLLNFTNGTVDLRTGALRPHDPEDRISCLIRHDYNDAATAPLWEQLIRRCTQVDPTGETAEFLQRVLGYMLLGRNIEQRMFLFVGPKRTGKSKIVEIVANVLGDYGWVSQPKLITRTKFGTHHESETWSIRGKRYVAISETDAGMDLDEAMVKNLTGATTLSMRQLYKGTETQVLVSWSIIVGTNEEPNIERWDDAIARRMVKIPSGPSLDPSEVDFDLEDKILTTEVEGVLAWLVRGAVEWHRRRVVDGTGLAMPAAVEAATKEFEHANDHVADFLSARVEVGPGFSVTASALNEAYKKHRGSVSGTRDAKTFGARALYSRVLEYFKEREQETGVEVTKDARSFHGIGLVDESAAVVEPWMVETANRLSSTQWG